MEALHDTRSREYRTPYGAVEIGVPVTLSLDVWDAQNPAVLLRTWIDGEGEALHEMKASPQAGAGADGMPARFQVTLPPESAGIIWYHFIITTSDGQTLRYGALDGRTGGTGQLRDWEPPSFQLSVYDPKNPESAEYEAFNNTPFPSFAQTAESFLLGHTAAPDFAEAVESFSESYPACAWPRVFNLLGIPGQEKLRLFLRLSGVAQDQWPPEAFEDESRSPQDDPGESRNPQDDPGESPLRGLNPHQMGVGKGRLWCASLIQALMPAIPPDPAADDGAPRNRKDAARAQGARDAYAELGKLWGRIDPDCQTIVCNAADIRRSLPLFEGRTWQCFAPNADVFGFWRADEAGAKGQRASACLLINPSLHDAHDVAIPLASEALSEVISGYGVPLASAAEADALPKAPRLSDTADGSASESAASDGAEAQTTSAASQPGRAQTADAASQPGQAYARVHLNQLGSALLYMHPHERIGKRLEAGMGVLAHITSLPNSSHANGDAASDHATGEAASIHANGDATSGHATGEAASIHANGDTAPDQTNAGKTASQPSGTLGEPARAFAEWLARNGIRYWQVLPVNPTDNFGSPYAGISAFAGNARLLEGGAADCRDLQKPDDNHAYRQFCERERGWLEPYACFMAIRDKLGQGMAWQAWPEKYKHYSPELLKEDDELSSHARKWRHLQFSFEQQWSDLHRHANAHGVRIIGDMPLYVSPDSADVWANPELFQLDASGNPTAVAGCPPDAFAAEGQVWGNPLYNWEALRTSGYSWWLRRLERAFELYDVVRLDHFIGFARYFSIPTGEKATAGTYRKGPGIELFEKAQAQFGQLPLIAEDLGLITPGVRALVAACGFPGMDIVQFVDGGDPLSGYQPRPEKIAYSGTHDNQTLVGYCESRYPHLDARTAATDLLHEVADCSADIRIFPLQDLMGLGDECRMNTPGTAEGNWTWCAHAADLEAAAQTLRALQ